MRIYYDSKLERLYIDEPMKITTLQIEKEDTVHQFILKLRETIK